MTLYSRLNPSEKQFTDFFNVRGRKDALAKILSAHLGLDATMQNLTSEKVVNEIAGTNPEIKEEFLKEAMSIQGSGWVYLARNGKIKKIKNHQIKNDIILLVDWWEHAWALDYQSKKDKYLENIWKIINWDVVNDRLNIKKARMSKLLEITKNL